ncbi:MAG: nitrate reductase [Verrucomicrobiota bacterium]
MIRFKFAQTKFRDKLLRATKFRNFDGSLTQQLRKTQGAFGTGLQPHALAPDATTNAICGFCATGCSLSLHLREGQAVNLTPDPDHPVNYGMACPKGWEALTVLDAPNRATTPLMRRDRGQALEPCTWEEAAHFFCERMKLTQARFGKESAAFISTGQICLEEMAFLGAFAKFGMGILHGDGNTRQCMATAVMAYKESFGFDSPPYTYGDFQESDVLVFVGSNLCISHPIMWEHVEKNPHQPKIIVLDPRRTETAMAATHHVPLRPKSDLTLLYCLAREILQQGWQDKDFIQAHTEGFAGLATHLEEFTLEHGEEASGIPAAEIQELARLIGQGKRVSFWWTMGVNQSHQATRTAQAIINLALLTGNIGRPGTGANSITGQCNAMGSRLFSNTTNLLGGHRFEEPAHREKVASLLGIPIERIPTQVSLPYHKIMEGIDTGDTKALWVIATNPAHSWINQNEIRERFDKLEFLVVQDMYADTETAELADLVLPAASWGEKEGSFINSERRIGLVKQVRTAPGQALSDFRIFQLLAHEWGCGEFFAEWDSPESVFQLLKELTRGQPCDITGIRDYHHVDTKSGIQWPLPEGSDVEEGSQRRLFADGKFFRPNGKAQFVFDRSRPGPETPDPEYPFYLLTGRGTSAQWHTQTRTRNSRILRSLYPQDAYIEINAADAEALDIEEGQAVRVDSRRGSVTAAALLSPAVTEGSVFLPMHYVETNQLTHSSFDPHSHQPNYKAGAVRLTALARA